MNRKITIENYESWFMDYLDGVLSEGEIIALEKFLLDNPELRKELEGLEESFIFAEEIKLPVPENLKQIDLELPVDQNNLDFFLIAEQEGDLTAIQQKSLNDYLARHPGVLKVRNAIASTRLKPDQNLAFNNKEILRKKFLVVYRREMYTLAAMAASIAILLTFWLGFMNRENMVNNLADTGTGKEEVTSIADSTSSSEKPTDKKESLPLPIPEKPAQAIKKAATKISFKTGIPIAATVPGEKADSQQMIPEMNQAEILRNVRIDPSQLTDVRFLAHNQQASQEIRFTMPEAKKASGTNASDYMTLGEFAVQKLSDIIFPEEKKELNAITIASAGINKINEVAGTNMKLEASARGENEKVLSFNSRLISFTTPINRE